MSFIESPRFPDVIAFSAIGGPGFSTNVVTLTSGYEARNINWSSSRHGYDLAIPVRGQTEVDEINAFFRIMQGRAHGFRFKDWSDYQVTNGSTIAMSGDAFQMQKVYTSGTETNSRIITKPVGATIQIYVNGYEVMSGFSPGYTLDEETGIIYFDDDPDGVVTWSGEFDVPVRFDTDTLRWRVVDRGSDGLLYQVESLPLVEIRI
jgi:uncharacterized protein (TIGR02217 family)